MPLQFNPGSYLQALEYRDSQNQRPDPRTISEPLMQSLDLLLENKRLDQQAERQKMLDEVMLGEHRAKYGFDAQAAPRASFDEATGQVKPLFNKSAIPSRIDRFYAERKLGPYAQKVASTLGRPQGYSPGLEDFKTYGDLVKDTMPKGLQEPRSMEALIAQRVNSGEMTFEQAMKMMAENKRAQTPGMGTPKQLPPPSLLAVNEGKAVARMLPEVEQAIKVNMGKFGPITGRLRTANPYDVSAQTFDARMRTASQAFGRFMEKGVLRKEDEEKYRKMFPQASDDDQVKMNKLAIIRRQLAAEYQSQRDVLGGSGYDVSGLGELVIPQSIFDESKSAEDRYSELEAQGMSETDIYATLAQEGY